MDIPCERTCLNPTPDCSDHVNIESGCACPLDQYWDGEQCVDSTAQCKCTYNGIMYHDGQVNMQIMAFCIHGQRNVQTMAVREMNSIL